MKPISKALLLCYVIAVSLALGACSEKDKINPVICWEPGDKADVVGKWELNGYLPFSDTMQWNAVVPNEDKIFFTFRRDGSYSMDRPGLNIHFSGTYKAGYVYSDSIHQSVIKLDLTENGVLTEYRLQWIDGTETFRLDWWWLWCATGYSSMRYKRITDSSAN